MNFAKKKTGAEHFSITLRSAPAVINLSKKNLYFSYFQTPIDLL